MPAHERFGLEADRGSKQRREQPVGDGRRRGEPATAGAGEGPHLELDGFAGPLASLLSLAREHAIDLAGFPLAACIRQLIPVLEQIGPVPPLTQRADWLVMAAWLVLLRSRLLLPVANPAEEACENGADRRPDPWRALLAARGLAAWLDRRPQLGIDVFARGQPELVGSEIGRLPLGLPEPVRRRRRRSHRHDRRLSSRPARPLDCAGRPPAHPATPGGGYAKPGYVRITEDELDGLPSGVSRLLRVLFVPSEGKMYVPTCGTNVIYLNAYLNHSSRPNMRTQDGYTFTTRRMIRRGEELTVDYRTYGAEAALKGPVGTKL